MNDSVLPKAGLGLAALRCDCYSDAISHRCRICFDVNSLGVRISNSLFDSSILIDVAVESALSFILLAFEYPTRYSTRVSYLTPLFNLDLFRSAFKSTIYCPIYRVFSALLSNVLLSGFRHAKRYSQYEVLPRYLGMQYFASLVVQVYTPWFEVYFLLASPFSVLLSEFRCRIRCSLYTCSPPCSSLRPLRSPLYNPRIL